MSKAFTKESDAEDDEATTPLKRPHWPPRRRESRTTSRPAAWSDSKAATVSADQGTAGGDRGGRRGRRAAAIAAKTPTINNNKRFVFDAFAFSPNDSKPRKS